MLTACECRSGHARDLFKVGATLRYVLKLDVRREAVWRVAEAVLPLGDLGAEVDPTCIAYVGGKVGGLRANREWRCQV